MKTFRVNADYIETLIGANNLKEAEEIVLDMIDIHEEIEYCTNCEKQVEQTEVAEGEFGCPFCKRTDCIEYRLVD